MKLSNLSDKEEMFTKFGVSKDIICKDCIFKDNKYNDYIRAICEMYPDWKPTKLLFDNVGCEHYEQDCW